MATSRTYGGFRTAAVRNCGNLGGSGHPGSAVAPAQPALRPPVVGWAGAGRPARGHRADPAPGRHPPARPRVPHRGNDRPLRRLPLGRGRPPAAAPARRRRSSRGGRSAALRLGGRRVGARVGRAVGVDQARPSAAGAPAGADRRAPLGHRRARAPPGAPGRPGRARARGGVLPAAGAAALLATRPATGPRPSATSSPTGSSTPTGAGTWWPSTGTATPGAPSASTA